MAVASDGPYASLHLALDRYPRQHPTTQFFTGLAFLPASSVKALKELWSRNVFSFSLKVLMILFAVQCRKATVLKSLPSQRASYSVITSTWSPSPAATFISLRIHSTAWRKMMSTATRKTSRNNHSRILVDFKLFCLLVGHREEHLTWKNWVMRCWHGYLPGARCKWFVCGPLPPYHLLLH